MASIATRPKSVIPLTETSHPDNPIPEQPQARHLSISTGGTLAPTQSPPLSDRSTSYSDESSGSEPSTPGTDVQTDDAESGVSQKRLSTSSNQKRRASTILVSSNSEDVKRLLGDKICCGGGCCKFKDLKLQTSQFAAQPIEGPGTAAYNSLNVKTGGLGLETELTDLAELPAKTMCFESSYAKPSISPVSSPTHPPTFVTPHPPYSVFSAPLRHARELTKPGAEKRTFHFDLDITDYPTEGGDVDFVVGGAIGVCAPNPPETVNKIFDLLGVPSFVRDKQILLKTHGGRWPTIWGHEQARELVTTRRELLTWCADVQSYPPTKSLFRLLAEYAESPEEKKILMFLSSAQGQASFCDLRTGPFLTLIQILSAFPSSRPPLDHLFSITNTLMPRFYSLSQDPQLSRTEEGGKVRKNVEIAVTVHESDDWAGGKRAGVGSGFLQRLAQKVIDAEKNGIDPSTLDLRVPMFRGLMANPLAREFVTDGPMLLIGAGVGVAPFRGFVQRRLQSANCANKVWVLQGIRDSLVDELYSGEWGVEEEKVKKVVQSRRGSGRYVQEEVRHQADLVWFIINALDGRIFVCGSSKGMGEGVESALVDVARAKGNLNEEEAKAFWEGKKKANQFIMETW